MLKNKIVKLFLIFEAIILSLISVVGCSNIEDNNDINATYIETFFLEEEIDEKINIIDNRLDLETILESDTPEKYDDTFFTDKSLLIFKIIESNNENKSEIESYQICDNILNVYIETKIVKDNCANSHWWFILELNKDDIKNFDNIKIFKNNEEIMNKYDINYMSELYYMNVIDLTSSITFNYQNPNYGYISLSRSSSYIYNFNGKQIYKLVSKFNNIPLNLSKASIKEEFDILKNSIIIEVSYTYSNRISSNNDAIVYFYILENGMFLFEDNRKANLYYSDCNVVNFNNLKKQIMQIGGNK